MPCPIPLVNRRQMLGAAALAWLGTPRLAEAQELGPNLSWLADLQQPPAKLPEDELQLAPLLVSERGEAITDLAEWRRRRTELRRWWLEFLGVLPRPVRPPALSVLEEENVDGIVRQRVAYDSLPDWPTEAYLLKPAAVDSPRPAVAVFHSTVAHSIRQPAGVEGAPEKAFGLKLAQRGCVTFCRGTFSGPTTTRLRASRGRGSFTSSSPARGGWR